MAEYENSGQQPWDDALTDPTKALAPYDQQKPPADWNDIYNNQFGNDDEGIRAQQAANMAPFEAPTTGFIRPRDDTGGRHDKVLNPCLVRPGVANVPSMAPRATMDG